MELFSSPRENFLYLRKWKPQKSVIFSLKKAFLIFREAKTPKKFLIFSQKKAFLIFRKTENLYISGNGTFL